MIADSKFASCANVVASRVVKGEAVMCMRAPELLMAGLLLAASVLLAQEIPAGTVIPVMLQTTLDARKSKPGQKIEARVMQDVPLPARPRIRAGSMVIGHVVEVTRSSPAAGSRIVISFDRLRLGGADIPMTTSLRSLASMMEVFEARMPTNAIDDYGTTESDWVTVQIGGDVVYRGAGIVMSPNSQMVGKSNGGGDVTAKLIASRERGCGGALADDDREQALWLFSPSACGSYGFEDLKIAHAGRRDPVGQIALESAKDVHLSGGSGLLLRVRTPAARSSAASPASYIARPKLKVQWTLPCPRNIVSASLGMRNYQVVNCFVAG
jgi:hypothetical protein